MEFAATNQRVAVRRQQAPGLNHRADPPISTTKVWQKPITWGPADRLGRPMAKGARRCRLSMESGTNELIAQRP